MDGPKDDWLFDSLYRYERLHMFELPHATRCLEWADQNGASLYVGGFSDKHANEVDMLELPEVLQPQSQENVCAHTDFKIMCGGLTRSPITAIKCIGDMKVATAGAEACVSLWTKDPENTDLLALCKSLKLWNETSMASSARPVLIDHTPDMPSWLLAGMSTGSVTVWDLTSNVPVSSPSHGSDPTPTEDVLHGLKFIGPHVYVACSGEDGSLTLRDLRSPTDASLAQVHLPSPPAPGGRATNFAMTVDRSASRVAVLSAEGVVSMFETSQLRTALCSCVLDQGQRWGRFSGGGRFSGVRNAAPANLCIELCCDGTKMAVSGITGGVSIYEISTWSPSTQGASPLFTHTGHEAECPGVTVLIHTWHPTFVDTVLSADSEGNLHAWQWKAQLEK